MSTMIERVTKAILKAHFYDCEPDMYESLDEFYRTIDPEHLDVANSMARAAIKEMREPTEAMVSVFNEYHSKPYHPSSTYRCAHTLSAMIDAALNEETKL